MIKVTLEILPNLLIGAGFVSGLVGVYYLFNLDNKLRKPFAKYYVKRMVSHTIPGIPSPCAVSGGKWRLTLWGAKRTARNMQYETSDGRGVYYGEIKKN